MSLVSRLTIFILYCQLLTQFSILCRKSTFKIIIRAVVASRTFLQSSLLLQLFILIGKTENIFFYHCLKSTKGFVLSVFTLRYRTFPILLDKCRKFHCERNVLYPLCSIHMKCNVLKAKSK